MNPILNQLLAPIKIQEMLQEADEARASRKARMAHPNPVARKFRFALAAAALVVLWIVSAFVAG